MHLSYNLSSRGHCGKKQWQNFSQNLGMKNETTLGRRMEPWELRVTFSMLLKFCLHFTCRGCQRHCNECRQPLF